MLDIFATADAALLHPAQVRKKCGCGHSLELLPIKLFCGFASLSGSYGMQTTKETSAMPKLTASQTHLQSQARIAWELMILLRAAEALAVWQTLAATAIEGTMEWEETFCKTATFMDADFRGCSSWGVGD